ncbi:hypothetical protein FA10DRAFT_48053 [Acaromyces ingoldii]|uniref:Peptidase S1 domain-containing protein n=1 Tax=Acaromyces ingoldii TaxID=215250 RepID=A0A316YZ27_9BASI|nr:hypothetical protein FA10DRAFT_48053 [Acaromyces ingoldii]PWN94392.1 hypothetical protein FA10DRAFT_48053 [Acaromyces ingoldii]
MASFARLSLLTVAFLCNFAHSYPVGIEVLAPRQSGAPAWASAASAAIHPGVNTDTQGGSCTSNYIYYDTVSHDIYIGQAAHCASTGGSTDTDGCSSGTLPEGTSVTVVGASQPGTLAYSSWARMQARGETDANTCAYNDLALIKLNPADYGKVNPSVPVFGGPTGVRTTGLAAGEPAYSFGNSVLRQGIKVFQPKYGTSVGDQGDGWSHQTLLQFGIPGDSGSAGFDGQGKGYGVLSTLALAPIPTVNAFGDLQRELAYLHTIPEFANVQLALGTEAFAVRPPSLVRK